MYVHAHTYTRTYLLPMSRDDAIRKTITLLGYIFPRKWMCLAEREFLT